MNNNKVPTIEMVGPGGRVVIRRSDLDLWRGKGYRLPSEEAARAPAAPAPKKTLTKKASKKTKPRFGSLGED